jgi:Fe-S cluster assembly iron-binding protein IscA
MLTITPTAREAVSALLASPSVPDGSGLRLSQNAGPAADSGVGIGLTIVERPGPEDQVVDTGGEGGVFVEAQTAELLSDQELDADIQDDRVTFRLRPQEPQAGDAGT